MKTNRVFSKLTIKAIDDDKREIVGIASTPSTDRMGDIVEPKGAEFSLPIPLLWQHDRDSPIGNVTSARVTKDGIEIKAQIVKIDSPPRLAARLEEAWQSIKHGLVRGLSIGFKPKEYTEMDNGGLRFLSWDWFELSAVTIPANQDATILTIKRLDNQIAAKGIEKDEPIKAVKKVGVTTINKSNINRQTRVSKMNLDEQIRDFESTRAANKAACLKLMETASDEGRTLDEAEAEEYDTLEAEIKATDKHLKRLRDLQKSNVDKAEPIEDISGMQKKGLFATAKKTEKLEKGIEFARFCICLGAAKGQLTTAQKIAETRYPHDERINVTLKAAVEAGTTTDATWALPLVEYTQFAGDFVEYLRPMTIIGKFGQGGIPALRATPFNVHIRGQTSGGAGYWVGQGKPKPLTKFDYNDTYLGYSKVANIAVLSEELMRLSNPSAEASVREALAAALIERIDIDFIDPAKSAVANVSPASVTNGVTPVVSSGNDADAIRVDVAAVLSQFIAANITPASGVWVMSATTALRLSLMRNALGQKEFDGITMLGGMFEGLPAIVSEYVPQDSAGHYVVLINASDIWLADDNVVTVDASREASLQMLDNPTNDASDGTATTMVSMYQTNSIALRAERWINWAKRRASAVGVISGVNWGEASA